MLQVKNLLIPLLIYSISLNSIAVTVIKAGDKAPTDGYLFTEYEAQIVRSNNIDLDTFTKLNTSYQTTNDLLQKSLTYRSEQVKILEEENSNIETRKYLYVAGGILVTIISIYAATKVVQATK